MPAERDKRTKRWRCRKWVTLPDGRRLRIRGTPTTNTKAAAEAAERRHIHRLLNPEAAAPIEQPREEVPTVAVYSEVYRQLGLVGKVSDAKEVERILKKHVVPWFGSMRLDEIRQADVDGFRKSLVKTRDPKTVNNITSILSRVLRYATDNGLIELPRLRFALKSQRARIEAVSNADVEKLLKACRDHRYRVAILLAATTGLRIGEIRGLQWGDINELHRQLAVERSFDIRNNLTTTKSNRVRVVPIPDRLAVALETSDRLGPWVVARLDGDRLGYYAARDALVALYDDAGVTRPAQPWHCLRHTYCTQLANTGAAPHLIQSLAGHQSFATTLRYIDPTSDEKRAAVAKAFGQHMANNRSEPTKKPRKR